MGKSKKLAVTTAILVVAVLLAVSLWFRFIYTQDNKYTAGPPYGDNGIFVFSENDLEKPLFLIDGWEFYLDESYTPTDFAANIPKNPEFLFIGQYSNFSYSQKEHPAFGAATYRLTLHYDGKPTPLCLEIPEIFTDYQLWIAGEKMEKKGNGRSVTFMPQAETQIILNVSNYSHYYSGLTYPPALGTPEQLNRIFFVRTFFYAMLCFCSLTLALYSCILWLTRERELQLQLHFGLLCLFFCITCLHPFIWEWGLSGRIWYAIEDTARIAMLWQAAEICSEAAGFATSRIFRRLIRPVLVGLCLICTLTVFFIIPSFPIIINLYGRFIGLLSVLCWLYLIVCAALGIKRRTVGGQFILAGGVALGASFLLNLLDNNRFEPIYLGWQTEYTGFLLVLTFGGMMIAYNRDILQKNRLLMLHMEDLVQKRSSELNKILEERKAFFSDMAHNLKAPIAAVHVFINLMKDSNLYLDDELRGYLKLIESENVEMQQRVQSLNTLNAFDRIQSPTERLDVDELLKCVYDRNAPETNAVGIYFNIARLNVPLQIKGQREKLLILFENLIFNAVSFTPQDGRIIVTPRQNGDFVEITVTDTGCGIAEEQLPHIFERFYVGRKNQDSGSGLGLYIAKITVEEMGGSICASSVLGKSTTFTIRLPLLQD